MAADLKTAKVEMYTELIEQVTGLVASPNEKVPHATNLTMCLANVSSVIFYALNKLANPAAQLQTLPVNWVGFYLMTTPQFMTLGPFQGKVACTEIKVGKGVCGAAVLEGKSQLVKDVHHFPGHIACDSESVSEVVIPIRNSESRVVGVLDIDSTLASHFDETDVEHLEKISEILGQKLHFTSSVFVQKPLGAADKPPTSSGGIATAVIQGPGVVTPGPAVPDTRLKTISGWNFKHSQLQQMLSQQGIADLEGSLGVSALPEILFAQNRLQLSHEGSNFEYSINLQDALANAAEYYKTEAYIGLKGDITVPNAELWKKKDAKVFDAAIDWAFRNSYIGTLNKGANIVPDPKSSIDLDMLKDTSLEILFFGASDVFEDDLHDFGISRMSFKFRVMQPCFFILLRHFIKINLKGAVVRETRIFHKFGQPEIIINTIVKVIGVPGGSETPDPQDMETMHLDEDPLCARMKEVKNESVAVVL